MKMLRIASYLSIALLASTGRSIGQFEQPEQFYSNGKSVDAWTHDTQRKLMFTFWFAQYSKEDWPYRQQIVIVYDNNPDKAYYFDVGTRRFEGRFDLEDMDYSMLPPDRRRERLEDIPESDFPPPGDMPTVGEMLRRPSDAKAGSGSKMMMPPATMGHPSLENSVWSSAYTTSNRQSVRARVELNGNNGRYITEGNQTGQLSNIRYEDQGASGHLITGNWRLGNSRGHFRFVVPRMDVNEFEGDWGFNPGTVAGTWRGTRAR